MKLPEGSHYVALGSSYAAGPGLGDRVPGSPRPAGRSTHNYAHLLADRLKLRLHDVTFSGATVAQIVGKDPGPTAAQLEAVTADTRLVTLTGGGNDVGYIGYLVTASLPWLLRTVTGGGKKLAEFTSDAHFHDKASRLGDNLMELFAGIRERAPKATIAVTDYLALLPNNAVGASPLHRDDLERGRRYFEHINLALRQAAARASVVFADVSVASAAHHAWSTEPWTERFVVLGGKAAPYHPNRDGMTHVADALALAIEKA